MREFSKDSLRLTQGDLAFLAETAAPDHLDAARLTEHLREDEAFRAAFITDERVVQRVVSDDGALSRISPSLYFQVLLTRAHQELEQATHTLERSGRDRVPVFDTREVVELLDQPSVITYLTDMLASFIRVESYVRPVRVRRGVWRKIRFNDMDIDSLMRLCATADEEQRLGLYKRIADVCLLYLGIFPEHARSASPYAVGTAAAPHSARRVARSTEEYEREGRRFYRMAGEHPMARNLALSEVFQLLHEKFSVASKPLNFIARHYLARRKQALFGIEGS